MKGQFGVIRLYPIPFQFLHISIKISPIWLYQFHRSPHPISRLQLHLSATLKFITSTLNHQRRFPWMPRMPSASELFHSRRYRFGARHNAVDISGFDNSLPDSSSSSSSSSIQHRSTNRRHVHNYSSQNNRREFRHDDVCDLSSRRIHRRRHDHSEHEPIHLEQGRNQSPPGSIINSDDFRSIHRHRTTGNDRLPGSVLLARERLVERLRGVSISGNRYKTSSNSETRVQSNTNNNVFFYRQSSGSSDSNLFEEIASESWQPSTRTHQHHHHHHYHQHPGLHQDALNCLKLEILNDDGEGNETLRECTICLEGFKVSDEVIRLHCLHVFHSSCLFPWIRVCGACPNCRKGITVNVP